MFARVQRRFELLGEAEIAADGLTISWVARKMQWRRMPLNLTGSWADSAAAPSGLGPDAIIQLRHWDDGVVTAVNPALWWSPGIGQFTGQFLQSEGTGKGSLSMFGASLTATVSKDQKMLVWSSGARWQRLDDTPPLSHVGAADRLRVSLFPKRRTPISLIDHVRTSIVVDNVQKATLSLYVTYQSERKLLHTTAVGPIADAADPEKVSERARVSFPFLLPLLGYGRYHFEIKVFSDDDPHNVAELRFHIDRFNLPKHQDFGLLLRAVSSGGERIEDAPGGDALVSKHWEDVLEAHPLSLPIYHQGWKVHGTDSIGRKCVRRTFLWMVFKLAGDNSFFMFMIKIWHNGAAIEFHLAQQLPPADLLALRRFSPSSFEQRYACAAEPGISRDLARWSDRAVSPVEFEKSWKKGAEFISSKKWTRRTKNAKDIVIDEPSLHVRIISNEVYVRLSSLEFELHWYEQSVIWMLTSLAATAQLPDCEFQLYLREKAMIPISSPMRDRPIFSMVKQDVHTDILFPEPFFYVWNSSVPVTHMNYQPPRIRNSLSDTAWANKTAKLVWRGSVEVNQPRAYPPPTGAPLPTPKPLCLIALALCWPKPRWCCSPLTPT
jgi:hypothetical protein